jgi:malonyl-CoA O-methyltransferase
MMPGAQHQERIRRAFSVAGSYDEHACVQRVSAEWLTQRLDALNLPPTAVIAEIGCGTGILSEAISRQIPFKRFLATDISDDMVERTRKKLGQDRRFDFATIDGQRPESLGNSGPFDLVCSNLTAQWFADFPDAVRRLLKLLKPHGCLLLSTLIADTFHEWRAAHERCGLKSGVFNYPSMTDLFGWLVGDGLRRIDVRPHIEHFASGKAFLRSLKDVGANTPDDRYRPLNAGEMRRVLREFQGLPQATYNIALCEFRREATF